MERNRKRRQALGNSLSVYCKARNARDSAMRRWKAAELGGQERLHGERLEKANTAEPEALTAERLGSDWSLRCMCAGALHTTDSHLD